MVIAAILDDLVPFLGGFFAATVLMGGMFGFAVFTGRAIHMGTRHLDDGA